MKQKPFPKTKADAGSGHKQENQQISCRDPRLPAPPCPLLLRWRFDWSFVFTAMGDQRPRPPPTEASWCSNKYLPTATAAAAFLLGGSTTRRNIRAYRPLCTPSSTEKRARQTNKHPKHYHSPYNPNKKYGAKKIARVCTYLAAGFWFLKIKQKTREPPHKRGGTVCGELAKSIFRPARGVVPAQSLHEKSRSGNKCGATSVHA